MQPGFYRKITTEINQLFPPAMKKGPMVSRMKRELNQLWTDPPTSCYRGAIVKDLMNWEVTILGPKGSPYEGGYFVVHVKFPEEYPLKPPKFTFKNKIFHPNINSTGVVKLDIFSDMFSPALTIEKLLLSVVSVLNDPVLDYPVDYEIAYLYKHQREQFDHFARVWTRKHAWIPVLPPERKCVPSVFSLENKYIPKPKPVSSEKKCEPEQFHLVERKYSVMYLGCQSSMMQRFWRRMASLIWR